jgi:hypothetical protein
MAALGILALLSFIRMCKLHVFKAGNVFDPDPRLQFLHGKLYIDCWRPRATLEDDAFKWVAGDWAGATGGAAIFNGLISLDFQTWIRFSSRTLSAGQFAVGRADAARSNEKEKQQPSPGALSTVNCVPCLSAIHFPRVSPSPEPLDVSAPFGCSPRKKRSKIRGRSFSEIPMPVSRTASRMFEPWLMAVKTTEPPAGVYFRAFSKRIVSSLGTVDGSPHTTGSSSQISV